MCGIVGFVGARADMQEILQGMMDAIAHRGPDGQGQFIEGPAALGQRRLSIIDLEGGKQPMFNEDQNLAVIFNGEIYNFQELTAELMRAGHIFATRSDTEVLLHGYEQLGQGDAAKAARHVHILPLGPQERNVVLRARPFWHQAVLLLPKRCRRAAVWQRDQKPFWPTPASRKS